MINFHADNLSEEVVQRLGSGRLINDRLIRKCPCVKAERSFMSVEIGVSGLEFKIASISIVRVLNS